MCKFDNHKDRMSSNGDLSFRVGVGDTVLLTTGRRTNQIKVEVTGMDTTSRNYRGVIVWSDVQEDNKDKEQLTEGREVRFVYDEVSHVIHPGED